MAAATTQGYADKVRASLLKKATTALESRSGNPLEFVPGVGTYKIRILPPIDPESIFYNSISYHFIPSSLDGKGGENSKGKYLYAKKEYLVDGKMVKDPIDTVVKQFYEVARRDKDEAIKKIAGSIKRKRNYICGIILYTDEGPVYRVLNDKTNEGKLMRIICATMGLPFWRDVEDNWVDKASMEIDAERDYYDLIDIEAGHDFKIVKKSTGKDPWQISYEDSFAISKPRALDKEERELLKQRLDLTTYCKYEEDYEVVKATLDAYLGEDKDTVETSSDDEPVKEESNSKPPKAKATPAPVSAEDDAAIDSLIEELD